MARVSSPRISGPAGCGRINRDRDYATRSRPAAGPPARARPARRVTRAAAESFNLLGKLESEELKCEIALAILQ